MKKSVEVFTNFQGFHYIEGNFTKIMSEKARISPISKCFFFLNPNTIEIFIKNPTFTLICIPECVNAWI